MTIGEIQKRSAGNSPIRERKLKAPRKPSLGQVDLTRKSDADFRDSAQAHRYRLRQRVPDNVETDKRPAKPVPPSVAHDAVSIMRIVLDAAYEGGVHLAYTGGLFSRFDRTHWQPLSEVVLCSVILQHLPGEAGRGGRHARAVIREVVDLLKMDRATAPDRARLADPLPVINVANGELWIRVDGTIERRPHDPASNLRYCLDVVYDPAATCPLYDRALAEIFSASDDSTALITLWHEFSGYVLQPARLDARIFVGWGRGNDGKSALAGLFVRLVGRDRVAAMPVGELARNPFMLAHLADKVLLLDDDVAVGTVLPDGLLKTISEDKVVTGEPKYRDPFEFRVRSVPLLLCNTAPLLRDTSPGFWRRIMVLPFERRFTDAEADRTLFPRIWAEERSGVLNRALAGLQRVITRGWKFDPPDAVTRATEAWWVEATGVAAPHAVRARRQMSKAEPTHARSALIPAAPSRATPNEAQADIGKLVPSLTVRVTLPDGGKACAVHVQTGTAAIEVQVGAAASIAAPTTP